MSNTAECIDATVTPLEAVMHRMGGSSGFPALSTSITDINRIVASDSESVGKLTRTILRDISVTNKLLHVVNSATYGQFGGRIHTVSKAVLLLGFEAVRSAAMSLMMLEFAKGKDQAKAVQDEIVGAYFAGVVSKSICECMQLRNGEEAVICTMFQNLGRLLATFFLYEESMKVLELTQTGVDEHQASSEVLGISYRELGIGMAKHWNFPDRLVQGMQAVTTRDISAPPKTDSEKLKIAANLANELCNTALQTAEADKTAALQALARRYASVVKVEVEQLTAAIDASLKEFSESAPALNLPVKNSKAISTIKTWMGKTSDAGAAAAVEAPADDALLQHVNALDELNNSSQPAHNPEQILSDGIRDVTETLVTDFVLNDVLQMVLETMYRGMAFSRTMIFIRDPKQGTMRARFGFGANIERIIPKCSFPLNFAPDVFHVSMDKGVDIVIEDALAPKIVTRIPAWHRDAMSAKSFLLLPVMVKNQAIGLFYADSEHAEGIKINQQQLGLLRTLRSQVVLALKQKM